MKRTWRGARLPRTRTGPKESRIRFWRGSIPSSMPAWRATKTFNWPSSMAHTSSWISTTTTICWAKPSSSGCRRRTSTKMKMVGRIQRETFQKAVKAGVKMAFGTDAGVYPHGDNAKQFATMVQFGMTPAQAIRTATQNSADLIGRSKDVGTIEVGKYADIIAVSGDPLQDVTVLQSVGFVMKGGTVYKDKLAGTMVAE